MNDVLYKKVGRRYVQVNDPWACVGLTEGSWLVTVRPGMVTMREPILPDNLGLSAAMEDAMDAMTDAAQKASRLRPEFKLTPKQRRAFEAFEKACGKNVLVLQRASARDIVRAGIDALAKRKGGK